MRELDLWTPNGSELTNTEDVGYNKETGESITLYTFNFSDPETGRTTTAIVPADSTVSQSHKEDMAAQALESWLEDVRFKSKGKVPTVEQRKDIGKQIGEFKLYAQKRRESTNNKVYYKGANL